MFRLAPDSSGNRRKQPAFTDRNAEALRGLETPVTLSNAQAKSRRDREIRTPLTFPRFSLLNAFQNNELRVAYKENSACMTDFFSVTGSIVSETVMHAEKMVRQFFEAHLRGIHDPRRGVLRSLVWMAMLGSALSLSRLARSLAQRGGTMRSKLKQVDHYVGHPRVENEQAHAARALLALSCRWLSPLVIAVDWSSIG
ncbi:MAG: hypothetical protein E6Q88_10390, partial [Lysobacteraceae bacterium]